jgi:hypothetical protein
MVGGFNWKIFLPYKAKLVFFLNVISCFVFAQEISPRLFIVEAGLYTADPILDYRERTLRMPIGFYLGATTPVRIKNVYIGGRFSYGSHDRFSSEYEDVDPFGFPRVVYESVHNQHFTLSGSGYYMPDLWERWQPYLSSQVGVRRVHSSITIKDSPYGSQLNSFTYQGTWMVQVGAGCGIKWKIKRIIIDAGLAYVETTAGTHLLRKPDWRTLPVRFSTDVFDKRRVSMKWIEFTLGINYIL